MLRVLPLLATSLALVPAGLAAADASHVGWPTIDGLLSINKTDVSGARAGTDRSDELLGGHGNDTLTGGSANDVLWGDYKPSGQPTVQFDRLDGGDGRDFIYASHGTNVIAGGAGDDVVHAHFGRGRIDCGPGHDLVFLARSRKAGWKLTGCETVSFATQRR